MPQHPTDKNYSEPENLEVVCWPLGGHPCIPIAEGPFKALKQEGAILGDSVRSFVGPCFRSGHDSYSGIDLHSWYVAYCKAHNLSPQGYNKFVHHLQRVPAAWRGIQLLQCFFDLAAVEKEDDSNRNRNRPHIPSSQTTTFESES